MRQLIIGDIHGCMDELRDLLDKAGLADDDDIIAIGDLVDRGPDSPGALSFFRTTPRARSVMGNHERKHVRIWQGRAEAAASQIITRHQIGEADYPAAVSFMDSLPRFLKLPAALLIHGFWEPGLPLDAQRESALVGTLTAENDLRQRGLWPWYERYDGDLPLVVGHRDYSDGQMKPFVYNDRVYCIDTRCVYGGALTGLLLPDFRLISVPSRGDHWAGLLRQHAALLPPTLGEDGLK